MGIWTPWQPDTSCTGSQTLGIVKPQRSNMSGGLVSCTQFSAWTLQPDLPACLPSLIYQPAFSSLIYQPAFLVHSTSLLFSISIVQPDFDLYAPQRMDVHCHTHTHIHTKSRQTTGPRVNYVLASTCACVSARMRVVCGACLMVRALVCIVWCEEVSVGNGAPGSFCCTDDV